MNQRLVWNFEFTTNGNASLTDFVDVKDEHLKWEIRYFWPENKTIVLNNIDMALLELGNYKHKIREDYYYLIAAQNYNIKKRRDQLLYKPLLKQTKHAVAYGPKIALGGHDNSGLPDLKEIREHVEKEGKEIYVKKEAFIYKLPTIPKAKIELSRLEVHHKIYFSVCIEGKSLTLVKKISKLLLDEPVSCDYVTFLKNITKL